MKTESTVSTVMKKNFLEYFLDAVSFESSEIKWILDYMLRTDRVLRKSIFVKDASKLERGLFISSECGKDNESLRFYFDGKVIKEADKVFNVITRYGNEPIYIQLDYSYMQYCDELAKVMESIKEDEHDLTDYELKQATEFIDQLERINMSNLLDKALDTGNKKEFEQLIRNSKGA